MGISSMLLSKISKIINITLLIITLDNFSISSSCNCEVSREFCRLTRCQGWSLLQSYKIKGNTQGSLLQQNSLNFSNMQRNYREIANKTMQSVCQICQKNINLQKVDVSATTCKAIFRIGLPNTYRTHQNKVSEDKGTCSRARWAQKCNSREKSKTHQE